MSLSDVGTSLSGFIGAHNGLQLLTNCNCITRLDNDPSDGKVKLLSGGGSGHEPAHAGYVGTGMLSGAICGDIFSSPSVAAILDCLRTVAGKGSKVIFVVKNYTGDRLNFGLAVERAKSGLGYGDVRMLLVDDDCSIEKGQVRNSVGKRGLAGVVLVHKILGAMAEEGVGIDEIYGFGEGLIRNMATIGFTFKLVGDTLQNVEIGKGIHGEPGVYTMPTCKDFDGIVEFLLKKLENSVTKSSEVVLLVNNLGGTSEFLMGIFVKTLLNKLKQIYTVNRIYCGSFLSSLDQAGISVTLLNLGYSAKLLQYLDYEVTVPSMLFRRKIFNLPPSAVATVSPMNVQHLPEAYKCKITEQFGAKLTSNIITFICEALISCRDMLNTIDKEAGDGDTGSTISRGAQSVLDQLNASKLDITHPGHLLQQISVLLERDMGGSSGALYSLFFQGASKIFSQSSGDQPVTLSLCSQALSAGNDTITRYALAQLGDRTMLDPLREGEARLKTALEGGKPTLECVEEFTKGCEEAARATQLMVARAGRAAYAASTGEEKTGKYQHPDPGAHAVSIWARAMFEACKQVIVE